MPRNLCSPLSTGIPPSTQDAVRPPTTGPASRTSTRRPASASRNAQANPASPDPTTTTSARSTAAPLPAPPGAPPHRLDQDVDLGRRGVDPERRPHRPRDAELLH